MDREAEPRIVYPLSNQKKWSKPSNLCEALPRETVSRANWYALLSIGGAPTIYRRCKDQREMRISVIIRCMHALHLITHELIDADCSR